MGQILFGICHKSWVRLEIFGNKEIYENQESLFGHQLSIALDPSFLLAVKRVCIYQSKKISKFLDHVQIFFVMNILSSILDNTIYCNCYNVTCYINIHNSSYKTHTRTESLDNTTWNQKKQQGF